MRPFWVGAVLVLLAVTASADCERPPPAVRAVPAAEPDQLSLATLNLWRLRDSDKNARYDEPLPPEQVEDRLAALARLITGRLQAPHLLAVQEVENRALLRRLAEAVAEHGRTYRTILHEGHDPSGMDVGLLYREPVRVADVRSLFAERKRAGQWLFSRPPLRVRVREPLKFNLVVVHLRSARGLREPDSGSSVRAKRRAQARALGEHAREAVGAGRPLVLAGDFNSAPGEGVFAEPWRLLDSVLTSVWARLPEDERYSHIHECERQAIDHIFYSDPLQENVDGAAVSRGNAGHNDILYGAGGTGSAVSDHDALVLYLSTDQAGEGGQ